MGEKQDLIKQLLEMQKKFIEIEQTEGDDPSRGAEYPSGPKDCKSWSCAQDWQNYHEGHRG